LAEPTNAAHLRLGFVVVVAESKAGGLFLDGPRRLEAAGGYHGRF